MNPEPVTITDSEKIRWARNFHYFQRLFLFCYCLLMILISREEPYKKWILVSASAFIILVLRLHPSDEKLLKKYNQFHKPISKWWIVVYVVAFGMLLWFTVIRRNWH